MKTKKPDTLQILQWMTAIAAIARGLEEKPETETLTYGTLAKAIGMTPDGWKGQYSSGQITDLLDGMAAVEDWFKVEKPTNYKRFVSAKTGKPGKGIHKLHKIVEIKAA
jgi:hypothetical protein